jgi:dipeptidyl aminopeptidase/acylaminoacyl peptidase
MSATRIATVVTVLLAAAATLLPGRAGASFPGANGPFVLAVQGCQRHLATIPAGGGPLTAITERCPRDAQGYGRDLEVFAPDVSADGRTVVALREDLEADDGGLGYLTLGIDGANPRTITPPPPFLASGAPSFAPDGTRFAVTQPAGLGATSLRAVRVSDGRLSLIRFARTCGPPDRSRNCTELLAPRWSPDGRFLAVVVHSAVYAPRAPVPVAPGIWIVRASDGTLVRRVARRGGWVDWSPDGRHLVYGTAYRQADELAGGASGGNLYVVDRQGRRTRELVRRAGVAETEPTWSPDGRSIAFVSLRLGGGDVSFRVRASLWTVRAAGGTPRRVRDLPAPGVEEGEFDAPELAWAPEPR